MVRFGDAIRVINMAPFNGATRLRLESVSSHLKIEHREQADQANIDAIIDPTVEVIIGYRVPTDLTALRHCAGFSLSQLASTTF